MEKKIKDFFTKEKIKKFFLSLIKSPLFYITLGAIIIDIVTKWIMVNYYHGIEQGSEGGVWVSPNFIKVTLIYNTGGIFGIGSINEAARVVLIVIRAILALGIPVVYLLKGQGLKKRYKVCIMLIYAGCIGNLIDGLFYYDNIVGFTGVVDWIKFSFFDYIFNLADSYVTVCVILILIFIIVDEIKEAIKRNRRGEFSMTPEEYAKKLEEEKKHEDNNQQK
ncbi:MAG: signal peptidase II [Bacilli bacterium]|nr:signal peptidase II [Bacilli bacterium]